MGERARPAAANDADVSVQVQVEKDLVAAALRKVARGQKPNAREQAALKRYEKEREEKLRWTYYHSIPQKHWREMSGRQTKVLNEQAERYGLPFGGPTIDLPKVVRALHDFLAANAAKLATSDELMQGDGTGSPALERYREERAALARLDRLERERQLLPRHEVREGLMRIAGVVRSVGDALQRQFGPGALELLTEGLDEAVRLVDRLYGDTDGETADAGPG
jgi:hypothetical protein